MNEMNRKPDFFALNRGTAATLDRKVARNADIDKDVMLGLNANDLSRKPATAYDFAFCFSLISFHFSWITITKYLILLIRSRSFFDTGTFLLADLRIDVQTSVHYTWLVALVIFLGAYVGVIPYAMFDRLRGHNDRLHLQSVTNQLGYLFQGLRYRFYWWEFLVMTRKLILMVRSHLISQVSEGNSYFCTKKIPAPTLRSSQPCFRISRFCRHTHLFVSSRVRILCIRLHVLFSLNARSLTDDLKFKNLIVIDPHEVGIFFFMAHAASQSIAIIAMLQLRMTLPHLQAAIAVHLMCEPFYSKGQQSLETFSLFAAAIMYHLGIMQKTAGNDSQPSIRSLILLLQFFLNGGILWAFIRFLFKATILVRVQFLTQLSKIQRTLTQNLDPRKPSKQKYPATKKKFRMKTYPARGLFIAKLLNFILARALYSHPVSTSQV